VHIFSYLLREEDDMPYPESDHGYIGNDDHRLEVYIPSRKSSHDTLIGRYRGIRMLRHEHEIHKKTHRESTCTESIEEVKWLEWMT